ncbi:MAG: DUF6173 family protein [Bradyrhizobium sp.]
MRDLQRASEEMMTIMRRKTNPAGYALERLRGLIGSFQSGLGEDVEIGISVVGSGAAAPFRLRDIKVSNPDILIFDGIDDNGNDVQLIQHHTQMAVMLVVMPKLNEKPFRIGFT